MGNTQKKIEVRYDSQRILLQQRPSSYEDFINLLKTKFNLQENSCFTFRKPDLNQYICTNYKFSEFISDNASIIELWDQVDDSVKANPLANKLTNCMFKILDSQSKIIGTGIKITEKLCIVPKSLLSSDDFVHFCKETRIEFFNATYGKFNKDGVHSDLGGGHPATNYFFICEIIGDCSFYRIKLPKAKRTHGYVVYFDSNMKMLQSARVTHLRVVQESDYKLMMNTKDWLTGGVIVSDSEELFGLYLGGIGERCISMYEVLKQASELCCMALENGDIEIRDALLGINSLELEVKKITDVFDCVKNVKIPSLRIRSLSQYYS